METETLSKDHSIGIEVKIITGYIIALFIYSVGDRFFFTKTIWDNVFTYYLKMISENLRLEDAIYILGIPVVLFLIYRVRGSLRSRDTLFFLLYSLILFGTAIFDPEIETWWNIRQSCCLLEPLLICYYASRLLNPDGWKYLIKNTIAYASYLWGIGCTVSFIYYLFDYWGYYHFGNVPATNPQGVSGGRLYGAFSDLNYASVVCLMLLLGILYILKNKLATKVEKVILWICLVLFVIYIALAYSRTVIVANIGLCFVISIYTVLQLKKKKALSATGMLWRVAVRFGILTVGLLAAYFLINCICLGLGYIVEPNRLSSELVRPGMMAWDETLGVADARIVIWSDYLHALLDRPLFGFSADGSFAYVCEHNPLSFVATMGFFHHHNTYVQALCQVGIVGFVLIYSNVFIPLIKFMRRVITGQDENCPAHVKLCFLWCVVALSAGFFYSIGFTQIRIEGCILWLALGGIGAYTSSHSIVNKM